jgi:hypothetical protein
MNRTDPIRAHIVAGLLRTADDLERLGMPLAAERFRRDARSESVMLKAIETGVLELGSTAERPMPRKREFEYGPADGEQRIAELAQATQLIAGEEANLIRQLELFE